MRVRVFLAQRTQGEEKEEKLDAENAEEKMKEGFSADIRIGEAVA